MTRRKKDNEEAPGGHAAERLREHLRDRFGDDPEVLPDAIRPNTNEDDDEDTPESEKPGHAPDSGA